MNGFLRSVCVVVAAGFLAGCASGRLAGATVRVAILSDDIASVNGTEIAIPKLGKKLKSMGATRTTTILVAVPKDISNNAMTQITRSLASEGLTRIFFTKPPEAEALQTPHTPSTPAARPPAAAKPAKSTKGGKSTSQKPLRSGTL